MAVIRKIMYSLSCDMYYVMGQVLFLRTFQCSKIVFIIPFKWWWCYNM